MNVYMAETIGVAIVLIFALYVAVKVLIEEISEEVRDYRRRNHWKKR